MFRRSSTWFVISLLCLAGAWYFWKLGDQWAAQKRFVPPAPAVTAPTASSTSTTVSSATALLPQLTPPAVAGQKANPAAYRLRNTTRTLKELERRDHAVVLENALLDTEVPVSLAIPAHLRAAGDPGSYIVQSRGITDNAFRARLRDAGASIVAYIPNNAYLVRASASAAAQLGAQPGTQTVLPYEPYYKLKSSLLPAAVKQEALPEGSGLNLLLFADDAAATKRELAKMGAEVFAEERSTFGTIVRVTPPAQNWFALATLSGVQIVEWYHPRAMANDMSRARLGVSADTQVETNYLNLTGTNVLVAVNDSWEFSSTLLPEHPDLINRVVFGTPYSLVDSNGHATHVAGIIAGSGAFSTNVIATNVRPALSSISTNQYRGKAPAARLYAMPVSVGNRPGQDFGGGSDVSIQESAALTNALISNNSWHYQDNNRYDLAAASYDAAVRDALPYVTGSQPVLFVFAAGNSGRGGDNGLSGFSDSVLSPGTAKNVITVGAMEQPRDITNEVWMCSSLNLDTNGMPICGTNTPWRAMTSDEEHVAGFSSRGNTGMDIEGEFGRFKPDVVAPGTFVLSTRSQYWNEKEYYNPTNHRVSTINGETVAGTNLQFYSVTVPENAVGLKLTVTGTADMRIRVWPGIDTSGPSGFARTNVVNAPPDGGANFGPVNTTWAYAVGNLTANETNTYTIVRDLITTNDLGNYFEVLSNLNNSISATAPYYYRYESGSSMAAAQVSGTLALMQEFYATKLNRTNSPALMKALLINGARSAGSLYFMQVGSLLNYQGWGLVQLPNSAPASLTNFNLGAPASMWFEDQSPTNALATGQSRTRTVRINNFAARNDHPLRATLVWTDPPGSPAAGKKLVNDLDLIVTNLDNGEVFYGNHIDDGATFSTPWDTNGLPDLDVVNNVENVYLNSPLGTNYTVTVRARHVNVNAVTAHADNLVQDYALVISSGDGEVAGALTVTSGPLVSDGTRRVDFVANTFDSTSQPKNRAAGFLLDFQRVGANTPLLGTTNGMTNQWHFYVATNTTGFTNAAFVTFIPADLSVPRIGVREPRLNNAARLEADIDLYVSDNPDLLNLAPGVVAAAYQSRSRIGTEQVVLTNAASGRLYYLGVKAEDQMAAEFSIFGVFSENPFGDEEGNVPCFNVPQVIPDRSPDNVQGQQNAARVVCPCVLEGDVRRVLVTNTIVHEHFEDLLANVAHGQAFAVLNNHRAPPDPPLPPGPYDFIYEDSGEGNIIPPAGFLLLPTDGPGSLSDFVGEPRQGPWIFTFLDDAWTQTGEVQRVELQLEESNLEDGGPLRVIPPDKWSYDAINIGVGATNLTVCVVGNTGPVELYIRKGDFPTRLAYDQRRIVLPPGDCLSVTRADLPPLSPGRYFIGVYNSSLTTQTIRLTATVGYDPNAVVPIGWNTDNKEPLLDDAVDTSTQTVTNDSRTASVTVTNRARIATVDVGLRVDHPRVSDLAFTLISPAGTRVLLMENRGGTNSLGIGNSIAVTNIVPRSANGGAAPDTNVFNTGITQGSLTVDYDFFNVPDRMTVYYDNVLIHDTGLISGAGQFIVNYGPGASTQVTFIMNLGTNSNSSTAWNYTVSGIQIEYNYLTFTEDTNRTTTPIKFFPPPFNVGVPPVIPISGFEGAGVGDYITGSTADGWLVVSNEASVISDPGLADVGTNLLAVGSALLTRTLPTIAGRDYRLTFRHRGPGIVSWWRGESGPSDSVSGAHGNFSGQVSSAPGLVQQGFAFPGVDGVISIPDHPALALTNSLSIEGWIYLTNRPFNRRIVLTRGDSRSGLDPYTLAVNGIFTPPGAIEFEVRDAAGNLTSMRTQIPVPGWVHVAATLEDVSDRMLLYVNGFPAAQVFTGIRPFGALDPLASPGLGIGNYPGPAGLTNTPYEGMIDELSVYHRAISGSEVKAIYRKGAVGKFDPPPAQIPENLAKLRISLAGAATNTIFSSNDVWQTHSITFTAPTNGTALSLEGLQPGVLLDAFTLTEAALPLVVLPEESLRAVEGENAFGTWQLEIWDSRTGATNLASLVSWKLAFVFQNDLPTPGVLLPGVIRTTTIPPYQIAYYVVDAPSLARFGTNSLLAATAPVSMYFNQNVPPARGATNAGDYAFLVNQTTGTVLMTTNSTPPLVPGRRYYLAIENTNAFNVTYTIMVDFDLVLLPPAILLTNGVPYCAVNSASLSLDYYRFTVSTNAVRAQFAILNPSADLTLLLRRSLPPTFVVFDYLSANPGNNDEAITVFDFSQPIPLAPGDWYFAAANVSTGAVSYCIQANEWTVYGTNVVPTVVTNATDLCITWASLPGALYYVEGSVNNTNWVTISPTIQATGFSTTYCIPLPTPYNFFRVRNGVASNPVILPPYITSIRRVFSGILISWGGPTNAQYQVQWRPDIMTPPWNTFTNIITSPSGLYQFLDDGSQSGGFDPVRFYRLQQLP